MYKNLDLECKAKYKCPKCNCPVFKAEDEDGKRIFVHRTCNGYADHAKHCPLRKPDVEILETNNNNQTYEEPKTTPKAPSKKQGARTKKASQKKPNKPKSKGSKKPLRTSKRATAGGSKSN